jgi:PAS domain S-box-containing protein
MTEEKIKVLLVDDNPGDVRLIQEMLKAAGAGQYELAIAGTLDGAIASLFKGSFDAVLLDLNLPDSSGLATMRGIQGNAQNTALVVITGLNDDAVALGTLKIGAEDFLVKGEFDGPRLVRSLKYAIERKRAEEELRKSEEKHRLLFETMAQGVVYQDADGKIISANQAAERILGLTLDQMQGRTSLDPRWKSIHEDGSVFPGETHPSMAALKTGQKLLNVIMGVFNPKENSHHWINVNAVPLFRPGENKPYQAYTTFEDITERKQAEAALRDSENKFRSIFDHATDGILLADMETKKFTDGNRVICDMLGYSLDEIKNLGVMEIHPKEDLPNVLDQFEKQAKGEIKIVNDLPVKRKDGSVFYADISAGLVVLAGKQYLTGIFRDNTERKRGDEELKKRLEELEIFYKSAMDREDRILELKKKVEELEKAGEGHKL